MTILALDPATVTGFAINDIYGTWNLKTMKDESWGMKLLRLEAKLIEMHDNFNLDLIAYERPSGRHKNAIITHSKILGIIERFCEDHDIQYVGFSASEIKKHATGKGNCGKDKMVASARSKLGYVGNSSDEADALWILSLARKRFGKKHNTYDH